MDQFLLYNRPIIHVAELSNAIICNVHPVHSETLNSLTVGVHLSLQNYIGSSLQISAVLVICIADLVHRHIKDCSIGLSKKAITSILFPFASHVHLSAQKQLDSFKITKSIIAFVALVLT